MERKLSPLEEQILEGARQGKRLVPVEEVIEGNKVVSLKELADDVAPDIPEPSPNEEKLELLREQGQGEVADLLASVIKPLPVPDPEPPAPPAVEPEPVAVTTEEPPKPVQPPVLSQPRQQVCPRCNHDMNDLLVMKPTEEDKLAFVEALLGNRKFERAISQFNNQFSIHIQIPTSFEIEAAQALLRHQLVEKQFATLEERDEGGIRIMTVLGTSKVVTGDKETKYAMIELPDDLADVKQLRAFDKRYRDRVQLLGAQFPFCRRAYIQVEELYKVMVIRSSDVNFW